MSHQMEESLPSIGRDSFANTKENLDWHYFFSCWGSSTLESSASKIRDGSAVLNRQRGEERIRATPPTENNRCSTGGAREGSGRAPGPPREARSPAQALA